MAGATENLHEAQQTLADRASSTIGHSFGGLQRQAKIVYNFCINRVQRDDFLDSKAVSAPRFEENIMSRMRLSWFKIHCLSIGISLISNANFETQGFSKNAFRFRKNNG